MGNVTQPLRATLYGAISQSRHNEDPVPKQIPQPELDTVLEAVRRFRDGATIEEISGTPEFTLPRRTLQRRLALLVEQKRLTVSGRGRSSRYKVPPATVGDYPAPVRCWVSRAQPSLHRIGWRSNPLGIRCSAGGLGYRM